MKNKLIISFILALAVAISSVAVFAADLNEGVGKDEIPYNNDSVFNTGYKCDEIDMMTEDEAKAANVPEGYSGYVLKLSAKEYGMGIELDLSHIRVKDIESITFRVYCPASTKSNGVRLLDGSSNWIMLADPGENEKWVEVVLSESININSSQKSFSILDDGTGYCKPVDFCIRFTGSYETVYIDAITVKLKAPDTVPPVVSYSGETAIKTTAGRVFSIDATAYDEYYEAYIKPEYIFSDGAVDENGLLLEGEHTCIVRFSDLAGNASEIELTLTVSPKDVTAPTLNWAPDNIFATVGMRPVLNVVATDDCDGEIAAAIIWSEGALDSRGRLTVGEHTLTITATDGTGNKTEKIIPVTVTSDSLPK